MEIVNITWLREEGKAWCEPGAGLDAGCGVDVWCCCEVNVWDGQRKRCRWGYRGRSSEMPLMQEGMDVAGVSHQIERMVAHTWDHHHRSEVTHLLHPVLKFTFSLTPWNQNCGSNKKQCGCECRGEPDLTDPGLFLLLWVCSQTPEARTAAAQEARCQPSLPAVRTEGQRASGSSSCGLRSRGKGTNCSNRMNQGVVWAKYWEFLGFLCLFLPPTHHHCFLKKRKR